MYDRQRFQPGDRFHGPALVAEYSATTVVPEDFGARIDSQQNIILRADSADEYGVMRDMQEKERGIMDYDPIRLEVFKNLLRGISEEMGVTLCRTSFSPNIKERRDFSCALFDGQGHMIAQAAHIPVHLGAMPMSVLHAIQQVEMQPGDGVLVNDPYGGGTHLPDITLVTPIFLEDSRQPVFFAANRAHHADVGGMTPGSMPLSTEVFQEGIRIPPVKIIVDGTIQHDLLQLILANVRTPREREGDLTAQIAANRTGERRMREVIQKYGLAEVLRYSDEILRYSERMTRHVIADLPDGEYTYTDYMDDDGIRSTPVKIHVTVRVQGDEVEIDFTGSDPQVRGSVNTNFAITMSAVYYCIRTLAREQFPFNYGCMVPVKIIADAGCVVNCVFPQCGGWRQRGNVAAYCRCRPRRLTQGSTWQSGSGLLRHDE